MSGGQSTFVLAPALVQKLLDGVVGESLLELIDIAGVMKLENMIAMEIATHGDIAEDKAAEVAKAMIDQAWQQLHRFSFGFDEDCACCALEAASRARSASKH